MCGFCQGIQWSKLEADYSQHFWAEVTNAHSTASKKWLLKFITNVNHQTVYNTVDTFFFSSYNKPTRCTNFSNWFWNVTLLVSDSSSVHHQEFFTVHTAMVYVIQFCWQLASRIRMFHPDPARKPSANLHDIYHSCVYSEKLLMMEGGTVQNM